jgi:hypothetical protein
MRVDSAIRDRYLRSSIPARLGALAANLARVESFGDRVEHGDAVKGLILESKYFIEWTAPDVDLDILVELVALQRQLAQWDYRWGEVWGDAAKREGMRTEAGQWSLRILEHSGLLADDASDRAAGISSRG